MFQLFLLVTLYIFSCQATSSYYINENYPSPSPDGSTSNPFISLSQAIDAIGATSCSFYLQGDNISITSTLNLPMGSDYVIQPDPSYTGSNFPLILKEGANIKVTASNLTLSGLEIIETNTTKNASDVTLSLTSSSLYIQVPFFLPQNPSNSFIRTSLCEISYIQQVRTCSSVPLGTARQMRSW
jgi:hypothetical protein